MKLKETNVCMYLMETKVVLYSLFSPLALVLTTLFMMVENSDECYQPNLCRCWKYFYTMTEYLILSIWKVISLGIVTWPVGGTNITLSVARPFIHMR